MYRFYRLIFSIYMFTRASNATSQKVETISSGCN